MGKRKKTPEKMRISQAVSGPDASPEQHIDVVTDPFTNMQDADKKAADEDKLEHEAADLMMSNMLENDFKQVSAAQAIESGQQQQANEEENHALKNVADEAMLPINDNNQKQKPKTKKAIVSENMKRAKPQTETAHLTPKSRHHSKKHRHHA